ncbi:MAG: hypothetical protein FJ403_24245 [Verrucomicrobia bacterium]|nr:hypothetical protein [Verrucomicrobiota bacterium]
MLGVLPIRGASGDADFAGDNPDIDLSESLLQGQLELIEKSGAFFRIFDINEELYVFFLVSLPLVKSDASEDLRLPGDTPEPGYDLFRCLPELRLLDGSAVIVPGGQDDFVASERHRRGEDSPGA